MGISRNLNIIETLLPNLGIEADGKTKVTKPQDLVRLYDGIIQMHHELLTLPGLEEDVAFQFEVEAKIAFYKASRCLYVAHSYAQAKRWQESAALYERCLNYADAAVKGWNNIPDSDEKRKALDKMKELRQQVEGKKYGLHAASILDVADGATGAASNQRPSKALIDRLDEYVEDPALLGGRGSAIGNSAISTGIPAHPLQAYFLRLGSQQLGVSITSAQDGAEQERKHLGLLVRLGKVKHQYVTQRVN